MIYWLINVAIRFILEQSWQEIAVTERKSLYLKMTAMDCFTNVVDESYIFYGYRVGQKKI